MAKKKNFNFSLSDESARYLMWLRETRSTNLSSFVDRLIGGAAAKDDSYAGMARDTLATRGVDLNHWGSDQAMEILGIDDDSY